MKKLPYIVLLLLLLYPVFSNATMIITSIEAKARYDTCTAETLPLRGCIKQYKVTWSRIPGPKDNEVIPSGMLFYGAMLKLNNVQYNCSNDGSAADIYGVLFPGAVKTTCVRLDTYKTWTWKMAEEFWISTYGATGPGIIGFGSIGIPADTCAMFAGVNNMYMATDSPYVEGPLVCVGAPPTPDPQCMVDATNLVFTFNVNSGQNTSSIPEQTQTTTLRCNIGANVSLMDASGKNGRVDFDWGYADVKINGQTLPVSVNPNPSSPITISAKLSGTPTNTDAGVSERSMVIVVGYL